MRRFLSYLGIALATFVAALVLLFSARFAGERGGRAAQRWRELLTGAPPAGSASPATSFGPGATKTGQDDPRPLLPREILAVVGQEVSLYFDGLVLAREIDEYRFTVRDGGLGGVVERRRWRLLPRADQIGTHRVTVTVDDWQGKTLAEATVALRVIDPKPLDRDASILIVGASNTHQSMYPNELWRLLDAWSPGRVRFVGTHHPKPKPDQPLFRDPLPQVFHEGYGGWSFQLFASHYLPGQEAFYKLPRSPFVFLEGGKPTLDVPRYLDERGVRGHLDAVVFDLFVNETFSASPDDPKELDTAITLAITWADTLVKAFREAAPEAKIVILVPQPFTRSEPVFRRRYASIRPDYGNAWRHRRVVQVVARRILERFDGKAPEIALVPLFAIYDTVDGYWAVDPGHPNELGARQTAVALFATLADEISAGK